jgi:autotransporter-associated beta strand protein
VTLSAAVNTVGTILNNGTTTGATTISGAIGSGVSSITQNSTSSLLILSGANSAYAGNTNVTTGTLRIHSATALGGNGTANGTGGALTIANGAGIENASGAAIALTTVNAININGHINFFSPNSLTFTTGAVTLGAAATSITSTGAGGFNTAGVIGGTSNLTVSAGSTGGYAWSGSVNFSGSLTSNGAGTGALTLSGGVTSNVTNINHSGGGNFTVSGGANSLLSNGNLTLNGSGAGTVTLSAGTINPNGTITNSGTTTGTTTITGLIGANVSGIIQNSSTSQLRLEGNQTGFGSTLTILKGTVFAWGSSGGNDPLGTASVILGNTTGSDNATFQHDQTSTITSPLLVRAGTTGTLTLRNINTSGNPNYNGAITMNNHFTIETSASQNEPYNIGGGFTTTVGSGHVLTLKNNAGAAQPDANIVLATNLVNFAGSIVNAGTGTRPATISAALGANITSVSQTSATSGLSLSGTNTNFAGDVIISAGTLTASVTGSLNSNVLVSVANGATLSLTSGAGTYNVEGLNGAGQVLLSGAASRTLSINGATGANDFSGTLNIGGATQSLTKTGASTQILSGTLNHNGVTTINGGVLMINGTHNGTAGYAVNSGGTLGGGGTINTTTTNSGVTVAAGGKLSPGATVGTLTMNLATGGVLNLTGAVTAANTKSLIFRLDEVGSSDMLDVDNAGTTSAVNIGTGVLEFNDFAFTFTDNLTFDTTYTLIDSNAAILGTLGANLSGNFGAHYTGTLSFADGGNDLVLSVVPEPGSLAVLTLGALALLRRRRVA